MKVLIADDCCATLEILRMNLTKWGYEPLLVSDGEQALRVLQSPAGPRLAVLDWDMPKLEGTAVCRELRGRTENAVNYTYVIVLTAREGEESLVEALEAGADDFLTKPVTARELQLRVRAGERVIELQDRVVRMNRKLAAITTHDQLTQLLNRNPTLDRLKQETERATRTENDLAYLMLDIDDFETINQQRGYAVRDELLKQVAERIRKATRSYDVLGRIGGKEFAVILPEADLGMGVGMAERIRGCIHNQPFLVDDEFIRLSVSAGIASSSSEGFERKRLVSGAEQSLRHARSAGGNCVFVWEAGSAINPLKLLNEQAALSE